MSHALFRWCLPYVQIFILFHAIIKTSIGVILLLQTDGLSDSNIPLILRFRGYKNAQIRLKNAHSPRKHLVSWMRYCYIFIRMNCDGVLYQTYTNNNIIQVHRGWKEKKPTSLQYTYLPYPASLYSFLSNSTKHHYCNYLTFAFRTFFSFEL